MGVEWLPDPLRNILRYEEPLAICSAKGPEPIECPLSGSELMHTRNCLKHIRNVPGGRTAA